MQLTIDKVINTYVKKEIARQKSASSKNGDLERVGSAGKVRASYPFRDIIVDKGGVAMSDATTADLGVFLRAASGVVLRWEEVMATVEADLAKERAKADWKTFINVLERLLMFLFLIIWTAIMLFLFWGHSLLG